MGMSPFGRKSCIFVGFISLVLVLGVGGSDSKSEVKGSPILAPPPPSHVTVDVVNNSTEKNDGSDAALVMKDRREVEKSEGVIQNDLVGKSNMSQPVGVGDDHSHERNDVVSSEGKVKDNVGEVKVGTVDGSESTGDVKDEGTKDSSGSSTTIEKGKPRLGECDSSNMCVGEKNDLVACLQVPGNDSPDLLLLIQNRGERPLTVRIAAPEFVQLETTRVQLQAKKDKKVKVSIGYDGIGSSINLTTNEERCTLDFKDLIPRDPKGETQYPYKPNYLTNLTRTRYMLFVSVIIIFFLASFWMCFGFGRKFFLKNGYQEIEMELPISVSSQPKTDLSADAWDNSWDDEWVDEEAPKTPTLPVTPSLSSRGLASRRLSKEGWKD